ncbi:MAG TPA: cupredoxin domain-containing protein [Solirubrobacteraceae bacterium]|jgi:plastocyanin|nr:cupredoxin domain-containing protein [Solirubrobacteraceae bacterium]
MILAAPLKLAAALVLAEGEPSKTAFYIVGAVFAAWAVTVSVLGLRSAEFPGTPARARLVMGISIVLALSAVSVAVATSGTPKKKSAAAGAAPASSHAGVTVVMKNIAFVPRTVTVHVGQKVEWINQDSTAHNVTAANGQTFQSPTFGLGGTFSYTPTAPGSIPYVCTIHPNMLATLIVKP